MDMVGMADMEEALEVTEEATEEAMEEAMEDMAMGAMVVLLMPNLLLPLQLMLNLLPLPKPNQATAMEVWWFTSNLKLMYP